MENPSGLVPPSPSPLANAPKLFRHGFDKTLKVTRLTSDSDDVDIDWNAGVVWVRDHKSHGTSARRPTGERRT